MYQKAGLTAAAGTTSGLAHTGANVVWTILAAFALVAAGAALNRLMPRLRTHRGADA